ncbi:hypothetical protein CLV98_108117 [Dyadobacter jejuensis]|uniref:Phospholipase D-like protein n=1 Tax=Dyadobacter jejuensis TaxID=1082580 RepID=A0A316B3Q4_9BACT|nr:hypothetical protein CLV98_108117 [Dyadobacter jejuensis]
MVTLLYLGLSTSELSLILILLIGLYLVALTLLAMQPGNWKMKMVWVFMIFCFPIVGSLLFIMMRAFWSGRLQTQMR